MEASPNTGSTEGSDLSAGRKLPLPSENDIDPAEIAAEDQLRANLYGLLARVLAEPMSEETLDIVRGLDGAADDTEIGRALAALGALAVRTPRGKADDEYTVLFFGMGSGGEMTPYGSFYQTGFIYEKPLAELRGDMMELGIEISGRSKEPEDHIAFLCEVMHGLITGALGGGVGIAGQRTFFNKHLAPWAAHFFEDLEAADAAALYMPVGTIGKLFMAIEAEAFEMAA